MKHITAVLMTLILLFCFTACGNQLAEKNTASTVSSVEDTATSQNTDTEEGKNTDMNQEQNVHGTKQPQPSDNSVADNNETTPNPSTDENGKMLVVYFSCTGATKTVAEYAADVLNAEIYEIKPENPYTEEDLAYYTNGRADKEQNDPNARPAISGSVENMAQYDTILIGYPIWHGEAPRIISTFLESYDFSGKTILPFYLS